MGNKLKISAQALDKTKHCQSNFACLSDPQTNTCRVTHFASDDILFVERNPKIACNYFVHFGDSGFCNCPARKELYKLYKI